MRVEVEPHLARTVTDLIEAIASSSEPRYLYFWGHTPRRPGVIDHACLSQWFPSEFLVDGHIYSSAEQYMMASKATLFQDHECLAKILTADNPGLAKSLGRQVRGFNEGIWKTHRFEIAVAGNLAKFSGNQTMRQFLVNTGRRVLVEASPVDRIWGIGLGKEQAMDLHPAKWQGENLLGFALMEVRQQLTELE